MTELLGEWADRSLRPKDFTPGSGAKVPWKCRACEHTWITSLNHRSSSNRRWCPACAGRVVTATNNLAVWCGKNGREDLLGEWADRSRRPKDFTPGSDVKVPWQCRECGLGWDAVISNRTKSEHPTGCPTCNLSGRGARRPRGTEPL
jgi:hypothetical protein